MKHRNKTIRQFSLSGECIPTACSINLWNNIILCNSIQRTLLHSRTPPGNDEGLPRHPHTVCRLKTNKEGVGRQYRDDLLVCLIVREDSSCIDRNEFQHSYLNFHIYTFMQFCSNVTRKLQSRTKRHIRIASTQQITNLHFNYYRGNYIYCADEWGCPPA